VFYGNGITVKVKREGSKITYSETSLPVLGTAQK
jgi:hypothetical protein